MLYGFELVEVEHKKINKKKVFFTILIFCIIALGSIGSVIGVAKYKKQIELDKQAELIKIEEQRKFEEEERIKKEEEAKEKERLKNSQELTEEQMQAIENIYQDVGEKRVFLTFDDGPTMAVTPFILDLLKQENIKATFFVLGNRVKVNPELIQREFNEGHYIANHGYTHKYSDIYQNAETVLGEYNYTEQAIQEALGNPDYHSRVFRFPGGSTGGYYRIIKSEAKEILRNSKIVSLDWNCLSKDAEGAKTKEELLQNVIETMGEKQSVVILMHDAADKILTYEVLPEIIQYLRENGYTFKNLYDIL